MTPENASEYGIEIAEAPDGTSVGLLTHDDDILELDFVQAVMQLRNTNEDAFRTLWDVLDHLLTAPPGMSA